MSIDHSLNDQLAIATFAAKKHLADIAKRIRDFKAADDGAQRCARHFRRPHDISPYAPDRSNAYIVSIDTIDITSL